MTSYDLAVHGILYLGEQHLPGPRFGPRFIRRALLMALLAAPVAAAERHIESTRAAAQAIDPETGKPTRAIRNAPEELQMALDDARAAKKAAEVELRDRAPGGCRPAGGRD
jgi:hypothetical protein